MRRRAGGLTGRRAVVLLLLGACAGQSVRPSARPPALLGPENRVLISDFSQIDAVAATPWLVFAATPHGLLIYDRATRRFKPPVTALDGYPAGEGGVRRAVADASGNAVFLNVEGERDYLRYDADARAWTRGLPPPDPPSGVLTVEGALAHAPLADAMRAAILTDSRLRAHQFTAAAGTPDRPELFFGTNGMGMVRVDRQTGEWEVLTYGLVAPGVGAVAAAPDGMWAAANARPGQRRGLTWVAADLSATRAVEGDFFSARRLLTIGNQLWLATEQGVLRLDPANLRSRLFDLPNATSLARAPDGVWVGTHRGLAIITADDRITTIGPSGLPILSLLAVGDTLWVGTTTGLAQVVPGAEGVSGPLPEPRVTILALARLQDTIVLASERDVLWRSPATREWTALPLSLALGTPTALAADPAGGLWIGGTRGLAHADIARADIRVYTAPSDLPAPVRDLAADRDYLWLATDSGLVRLVR